MAAAAGPAGPVLGRFVDWIAPRSVKEEIESSSRLIPEVAQIADEYLNGGRIGAFTRNFWEQRGVAVGELRPINHEFFQYWYGRDPVDPRQRVCDTHHHPVWIPQGLSLATLESGGLQFSFDESEALAQHKNTDTTGGYYAVMRKEVLGRNVSEEEQIRQLQLAGYPGLSQAADVAAVIFAANQHDQSRWLGDDTGVEKRWTYTRCAEKVNFSGALHPLIFGGFQSAGPQVDQNFGDDEEHIGAAAIQRF